MMTAISTERVCLGLTMSFSGDQKNSFLKLNNPLFSSTLPSNFKPFTSSPKGYSSMNMFCRPTSVPVVCMAQRKASGSSKKKNKIIRLVSTAGTGFFYAVKKSKKLDKIELKKYDPKAQDQVVNIIIDAAICIHFSPKPENCSGSFENLSK